MKGPSRPLEKLDLRPVLKGRGFQPRRERRKIDSGFSR
jgi:hypothetical protein